VIRLIPDIDRDIVWIDVEDSSSIRVHTGRIHGPLAGSGNVITMMKRKGRWTVVGDPRMSVWNA
jgi:hypothetical protein